MASRGKLKLHPMGIGLKGPRKLDQEFPGSINLVFNTDDFKRRVYDDLQAIFHQQNLPQ